MADDRDRELSRLWRIFKTTKQMCYDRGYELSEDEINISLDQFRSLCADETGSVNRARMAFTARPTEEMRRKYTPIVRPGAPDPEPMIGTIHVEFATPNSAGSIGIKEIKAFAQLLSEKNYYTGIFVSPMQPSPSALKIIPSLLPTIMEIFREEDLIVNISKHELVPKHVMLSAEEKRYLLERYRLKETQLPRVRVEDPMARYLGLRRGQVVKIIRKSETAGRYASYRWAI
ncbi:RNA polymerase subunit [Polychaeton citri CBS 116435]|uniref:DNA-directed RNA polymerases I, II, and III subunit RPABC1 n=1 Tax=Polychaeton citri CBS 116435 TaxID=1314669 RepID=A0A9P4QGH7_9PEZI|nr:RNA polymerase subunit [Polychaeton citri CBS 116435]